MEWRYYMIDTDLQTRRRTLGMRYIEMIAALLEGAGERELRLVYLYVYHLIRG